MHLKNHLEVFKQCMNYFSEEENIKKENSKIGKLKKKAPSGKRYINFPQPINIISI